MPNFCKYLTATLTRMQPHVWWGQWKLIDFRVNLCQQDGFLSTFLQIQCEKHENYRRIKPFWMGCHVNGVCNCVGFVATTIIPSKSNDIQPRIHKHKPRHRQRANEYCNKKNVRTLQAENETITQLNGIRLQHTHENIVLNYWHEKNICEIIVHILCLNRMKEKNCTLSIYKLYVILVM